MNRIRFQHTERSKTTGYRVEFFAPGSPSSAHSFETSSVIQSAVTPPTYDISLLATQKPPTGTYEITVTAIGAIGSSTSERSAPFATELPPAAPTAVTVLY